MATEALSPNGDNFRLDTFVQDSTGERISRLKDVTGLSATELLRRAIAVQRVLREAVAKGGIVHYVKDEVKSELPLAPTTSETSEPPEVHLALNVNTECEAVLRHFAAELQPSLGGGIVLGAVIDRAFQDYETVRVLQDSGAQIVIAA